MRKRAERKKSGTSKKPKHITKKKKSKGKTVLSKKNCWVALSLIGIFLLVLFFNSYFNITSGIAVNSDGEGLDKFYLSGPDPYYNMRLVEQTKETGEYHFYAQNDPLLNYPLGRSGGRRPLLNMMSIGFSRVLTPFVNDVDALGYSMQFVPALFGALLVFPVYLLGKTLFNKKAGLLAALMIALIPIHIGSGHGSSYSLFDHDSFNYLMFFLTFAFLVKGIKEKDRSKSFLYAILAGVPLAGVTMTWVEAEFVYVVIVIYAVVQMIIDMFRNKMNSKSFLVPLLTLVSGYFISLPVLAAKGGFELDIPLFLCILIGVFGFVYYLFDKKNIPWTLSFPIIFGAAGIGLVFLYFIEEISKVVPFVSPLSKLSGILYGTGIYGNKVSLTIAEASTFGISKTVMSFGPVLFWLGFIGFVFLLYYWYKEKLRRDYLFMIVLFIIDMWLISTAGRFLNDLVPLIALLSAWMIWLIVDKVDFKKMFKNIRRAGGGFHGIRRGVKPLHVIVVLFVAFLVVFPNAYLALDASVPNEAAKNSTKQKVFGDLPKGAFGLSLAKSKYWTDAFNWLSHQDEDIKKPKNRPAFISWWDYGFYESAVGEHPTVADNFQDGIPPAANFHTATSEKEAVTVWIVRLLRGNAEENDGELSEEVVEALNNTLTENATSDVEKWVENPKLSPSYHKPIQEKFHQYIRGVNERFLQVGAQWPENAVYHDVADLLVNKTNSTMGLTDEEITELYLDIQEATDFSIRYYGVEMYDKTIFNIFPFLADKSLSLLGAPRSKFFKRQFNLTRIYRKEEPENLGWRDAQYYYNLSEEKKKHIQPTNRRQRYLAPYFDTMFYNTYFGYKPVSRGKEQRNFPRINLPCVGMKHFYAEYVSNFSRYRGIPVVIAKYYAGAKVNGSLQFNNESIDKSLMVVVQKNLSYSKDLVVPINHVWKTFENGNFSVLTGGGKIKLNILRYPDFMSRYLDTSPIIGSTNLARGFEDVGGFVLKNFSVKVPDSLAMRKNNSGQLDLGNITIDPASLNGVVYDNRDNNKTYDPKVDRPLNSTSVEAREITNIPTQRQGRVKYGERKEVTTGKNGSFNLSDLFPGMYLIRAKRNNYYIYGNSLKLHSGLKELNISKAKNGTLKGRVYYDQNKNGEYDSGEELSDTKVTLTHDYRETEGYKNIGGTLTPSYEYVSDIVANTTTDSEGMYNFSSLVPGRINGLKLNNYTVRIETDKYKADKTIFPEENKTTTFNISVGLNPVNISGNVNYEGKDIEDKEVQINFNPDMSVEDPVNNTAKGKTSTTDETGRYNVNLVPGFYNVSANKTVKQDDHNVTYTFEGKLEIEIGEISKKYDIVMTKEE